MFLLVLPVFASDSPYAMLKAKGLPADYLDSLSSEMLNTLYVQIGENNIAVVSNQNAVLYETNNEITTFGAISSNSMSLQCIVIEVYKKNTSVIDSIIIGVDWIWQNGKPFFRLTDALSVNWDGALFTLKEGAFLSQDKWRLTGIDVWAVSKEYTRPSVANQGGIGYHTKLTADPNFATDIGGSTTFVLLPRTTIYKGTNKVTSINVNYVHNKNIILPTLSFTKAGIGVSVDPRWPSDEASSTANYYYAA